MTADDLPDDGVRDDGLSVDDLSVGDGPAAEVSAAEQAGRPAVARRRARALVEEVRAEEVGRSRAWARTLRRVAELVEHMDAPGGPTAVQGSGWAPVGVDGAGDPEEAAAAEVALALRLTAGAARRVVAQALALVGWLPVTMAALEAGRVDQVRARVVVEGLAALEPADAGEVDALLGPSLGPSTSAQLAARIRYLVARQVPGATRARVRAGTCERGVRLLPLEDGMAQLCATGPALDLAAVHQRLSVVAGQRLGPHGRVDPHAAAAAGLAGPELLAGEDPGAGGPLADRRRMDARRFDALVDLVCAPGASDASGDPALVPAVVGHDDVHHGARGGVGVCHGPQVVVALTSLAGLDGEPAQLAGLGPVAVEEVRELLAAGHGIRRALVEPWTGQLLGLDGHLVYPGRAPARRGHLGPSAACGPTSRTPTTRTTEPGELGTGLLEEIDPLAAPVETAPEDTAPVETAPVETATEETAPEPRRAGTGVPGGGGVGEGRAGGDAPGGQDPDHGAAGGTGALPGAPPGRVECPVAAAGGGPYRPRDHLERFVRARIPRCTYPGCRVPATRCDLDHRIAHADGGPTCECNLGPKCRCHHLAKHRYGWREEPLSEDPRDTGTRWTSPLGQVIEVPGRPLLPAPPRQQLRSPRPTATLADTSTGASAGQGTENSSREVPHVDVVTLGGAAELTGAAVQGHPYGHGLLDTAAVDAQRTRGEHTRQTRQAAALTRAADARAAGTRAAAASGASGGGWGPDAGPPPF